MLDKADNFYEPTEYHLIGKLVKIKSPGMLLLNESIPSSKVTNKEQIFDLGGKNIYLLTKVQTWIPPGKTECFLMTSFLLGDKVYTWRGIKIVKDTVEESLDNRLEQV